jgi:thiosulfate dehydrogenase
MFHRKHLLGIALLLVAGGGALYYFLFMKRASGESLPLPKTATTALWVAPDSANTPKGKDGALIRYGRVLISNTALFYGPKGSLSKNANGMNCQNCHLNAGTKPWGNNFGAVYSTYPRYRPRRNAIETIEQRINDCFERSMDGMPIENGSMEMQAMIAYFKWLGAAVPKGVKPEGTGIRQPEFLNRAADPERGAQVYNSKCKRCHGTAGEGMINNGAVEYAYPPLWGDHSFNTGAGLNRISMLAGYVKDNMPFDAKKPEDRLTNEQAWDVAAFVESRPRTHKPFNQDYPNLARKPFDNPSGPYIDSFPESQHKLGPFQPIVKAMKVASK